MQILELSQIPILAGERDESHPIVIGGGPCVYNPEPLADFFDMFYIGEGETAYDELLDLYKSNKKSGGSRMDFLRAAAKIDGIYVPCLYSVEYNADGTIAAFIPEEGIPDKVRRQVVTDLSEAVYPAKPVVPYIKRFRTELFLKYSEAV